MRPCAATPVLGLLLEEVLAIAKFDPGMYEIERTFTAAAG